MQSPSLAPILRERPRPGWPAPPPLRPLPWLAAVAVAFVAAQLVLVVPRAGLGWDETVYVSQVGGQAPAAFFSAPRARGITYLVAPMAALTTSTPVLRVYLAVLSGAALFLALWVWRRLLPAPVLALAGALFCGLWITVYYGPQVMPNLWVAFASLLAVGCFLRAVREPDDWHALAGLGAGVALAALMRPADALWLVLPLAAAVLCVRSWRHPVLLLVLAVCGALGCAQWIVEAYVSYGGLLARVHRASEIQGHMGWNFAVDDQLRALGGRTLCRPCEVPWRHPVTALWWVVLPVVAVAGCLAARRVRRLAPVLLPSLVAASMAVPYLFLIDYAAPRFLLPSYALLAIPVAVFLVQAVVGVRPQLRLITVAALAIGLLGHLAVQFTVLRGVAARSARTGDAVERVAAELNRQGVRAPCVLTGHDAVRVAFRAGCASRQPSGHDGSITLADLRRAALAEPVAVLVAGNGPPPRFARSWRVHPLPYIYGPHPYRAYISPTARP